MFITKKTTFIHFCYQPFSESLVFFSSRMCPARASAPHLSHLRSPGWAEPSPGIPSRSILLGRSRSWHRHSWDHAVDIFLPQSAPKRGCLPALTRKLSFPGETQRNYSQAFGKNLQKSRGQFSAEGAIRGLSALRRGGSLQRCSFGILLGSWARG